MISIRFPFIGDKALGRLIFVIGASGILMHVSTTAQTLPPGKIPGELTVSNRGAAVYRVPIQVPPGIAGMQPKLALVYNSQSSNGLLGVGWSIEGLSAVTRCPKTMPTDGVRKLVNHTNSDQYCLDGQRLVNTSGVHGADGSVYKTEIDNFSKVIADGTSAGALAATGPLGFTVKTKDGLTLRYGSTDNSRFNSGNTEVMRLWALSEIRNSAGQAITFTYEKLKGVKGELRIINISYGANRRIVFNYEDRADKRFFYEAGTSWAISKKLVSVDACIAQACDQLRLLYRSADPARPDNRSVVTKIEQYSGDQLVGETAFDFGVNNFGWTSAPNYLSPVPLSSNVNDHYLVPNATFHAFHGRISPSGVKVQDVNGDGLVDIVQNRSRWGGDHQRSTYLNTGSGWSLSGEYSVGGDFFLSIDAKSTNVAWQTYRDMGFQGRISDTGVKMVDLNGDGLADMVYNRGQDPYTPGPAPSGRAYINTGSGWEPNGSYIPPLPLSYQINIPPFRGEVNDSGAKLVDLNGDGLVDVLWHLFIDMVPYAPYDRDQRGAWINNGSGWTKNDNFNVNLPLSYAIPGRYNTFDGRMSDTGAKFLDVNGDGLVDMLYHRKRWNAPAESGALINTGAGWVPNAAYTPPWPLSQDILTQGAFKGEINPTGAQFVDLNGDGLVDMIWDMWRSSEADRERGAWLNTGSGWSRHDEYLIPWSLSYVVNTPNSSGRISSTGGKFLDINSDGLVDFVFNRFRFSGDHQVGAYINTGSGWSFSGVYNPPVRLSHDVKNPIFDTQKVWGDFIGEISDTGVQFADLDGDGVVDMLYDRSMTSDQDRERGAFLNAAKPLMLKRITQGGTSIDVDYAALTEKRSGYEKIYVASYPKVSLQIPIQVVRSVERANGIGGRAKNSYTFGGLRASYSSSKPEHVGSGRGVLGFERMISLDESTGIETNTEFGSEWPYSAIPTRILTKLTGSASAIKEIENNTSCHITGVQAGAPQLASAYDRCEWILNNRLVYPVSVFPHIRTTTDVKWELDGSQLPKIEKTYSYLGIPDESGKQIQLGLVSSVNIKTIVEDYTASESGQTEVKNETKIYRYFPPKTAGREWEIGRVSQIQESHYEATYGSYYIPTPPRVLNGTAGRDYLVGGRDGSVFNGGSGSDDMVAGDGPDRFVYTSTRDAADTITNFASHEDKLDFSLLFASLGVVGNGISSGHVSFSDSPSGVIVHLDTDGTSGPAVKRPFLTVSFLGGLTASQVSWWSTIIGNNSPLPP